MTLEALPNQSDIEAVRDYLQDIANQIETEYKVKNIEVAMGENWEVTNTEDKYEVNYFQILQIRFDYIKIQDNQKWWATISLYDPTDNDCFEDKSRVYRFDTENPKTYAGISGIENADELIWNLDNYVGRKEIEEIKLF